VENGPIKSWEAQAEYRFAFGLGIGGGKVESNLVAEFEFTKLSYRNKRGGWNYIASVHNLDYENGREDPGGFLALYNDRLMLVAGDDGARSRYTVGYIAKKGARFRPAFEILRVGNSDRTIFTFANATLNFKGGFLSHPARLGRAMGPAGLEYGNPLGFLRPTWNRRLDTWELGGAVDIRVVHFDPPSGVSDETYEAAIFPFQFNLTANHLDGFFFGASRKESNVPSHTDVLAGYIGRIKRLQLALEAEFNSDSNEWAGTLGVIRKL
jgi:hypothetical protein